MIKRFNSLYFGSIGIKDSFLFLISFIYSLLLSKRKIKQKLHKKICKTFSSSACFTYSSARGALADFLLSLDLTKNDEVILSSFTCLAVPTAIIAAGAKPVYTDIDYKSMNHKVENIIPLVTNNTKAIIVQHTMGVPAEIDDIISYAKKNKIIIIEDCALSVGTKINNRLLGTLGDASIFSFELSKTVSCGWGGILLINNEKFIDNVNSRYKNHKNLKLTKRFQMIFQTFLCGILYHPNIYSIGRYVNWIMHKMNVFLKSTPESEFSGKVQNDFISTLGYPQTLLASFQWEKIDSIFSNCNKNYKSIIRILNKNGFTTLKSQNLSTYPVSARIPFLIHERDKALIWFDKRGVELGVWFDGPLSPIPDSAIFQFDPKLYEYSFKLSEKIINFPCNSKICDEDIKRFGFLIDDFLKEHPNSIT